MTKCPKCGGPGGVEMIMSVSPCDKCLAPRNGLDWIRKVYEDNTKLFDPEEITSPFIPLPVAAPGGGMLDTSLPLGAVDRCPFGPLHPRFPRALPVFLRALNLTSLTKAPLGKLGGSLFGVHNTKVAARVVAYDIPAALVYVEIASPDKDFSVGDDLYICE